MAQTAIAGDVHKALDAQLNFRAQFTFYLKIIVDNTGNLANVLIRPILDFGVDTLNSTPRPLVPVA